jgi:vacuolar-type H+-ATPase subunit E/Vma4
LALEDILRALEEKADTRIEVIESEARQRVQEVLAEVEKETARTRRQRLKKVEDQIKSEASGIVYSASLKSKNLIIKAQEETVDEAFRIAEERLAKLYQRQDYPQVLEILLGECLEFFPEGEVLVQVRPTDRDLVEKLMSARRRPYRLSETPLEASGGLVVSNLEGQIVVSNTFESRLVRAKDHLRLQISQALFEA